ncbi:MAG: minichromosome maintenance protein MCM [Methanobrevibacter sp.]|nr:minichromosome maintenance protein MCM [Methanobrevibacter sp.]
MISKTQTSISKFEEFFATSYKDDVFEILEQYPDKRSLIVDYLTLEMFDPDLADLLIEKPDEVIEAAKTAIKNIDPLVKSADINIRFENLSNLIPLKDLNSNYVGFFVSYDGIIEEVNEPAPRIETGVFECRGCMRLHEVEQTSASRIIEPTLCSECGGRSFRLLQEESKYVNTQLVITGSKNTSRKLIVIFEDDLTSWDDYNIGQHIRFTGTLKTYREEKSGIFNFYLQCNHIERLTEELFIEEEDEELEKEYGVRDSPEYNAWRLEVVLRDKVCQCCGSEKHPRAHHIFSYENYPKLRVDPHNGIRLCKWCHGKYHSHYGISNANPKTFTEFIKRFGTK